jgi:hypothetical protein
MSGRRAHRMPHAQVFMVVISRSLTRFNDRNQLITT